MKRVRTGSAVMAALLLSTLLLQAQPASATFPGSRGEIAFDTPVGGVEEIHAVREDGQPEGTLVARPGLDSIEPAWSADGLKLAFAGEVEEGGPFAIFTSTADGISITQATQTGDDALPDGSTGDTKPTWSPDGSQIAFQRDLGDGSSAIFVVNVAAQAVRRLTDGSGPELEPAWSPDGNEIAYVSGPGPSLDCFMCTRELFVIPPTGGTPTQVGSVWVGLEIRDPDWIPNGLGLVAGLASGMGQMDLVSIGRSGGTWWRESISSFHPGDPSASPDRSKVAFEVQGEQGLFLLNMGPTWPGTVEPLVSGPAADPAWRPVTITPPTVTFTAEPNGYGWFGRNAHVEVSATDSDRLVSLVCSEDGDDAGPHIIDQQPLSISGYVPLFDQGVSVQVSCTAVDVYGTRATADATVSVDTGLPTVGPVSVSPAIAEYGDADVSAPAADALSGVARGEMTTISTTTAISSTGSVVTDAMGYDPSTGSLVGHTGYLPPDIYAIQVRAVDLADNVGDFQLGYLVVYNPFAGSTNGTGWIVPGSASGSGVGDALPGLDGKTKASFAFSAKYKNGLATSPSGFFNLSYGSRFKLQGKNLQWLAVTDYGVAYIQGTATIQGMPGRWTFRAEVRDGAPSGSPDRLKLQVWPSGADPDTTSPTYQASGDAGGQIRIVR